VKTTQSHHNSIFVVGLLDYMLPANGSVGLSALADVALPRNERFTVVHMTVIGERSLMENV
jgi:hypothetical protein